MHVLAFPRAVVGLVALRCDDPVVAKVLKVHSERVAAAAGLTRALIAVEAGFTPQTFAVVRDLHFHKGQLCSTDGKGD